MKTRFAVSLIAVIALPAFAHDPSLHKPGDAKDPDCAQMQHMDMSRMAPNDPVMKAMHDKCMAAMKHDRDDQHETPGAAADPSKSDQSAVHSHDNHNPK